MKVRWIHQLPDEPVLLYSEVNQGMETRKIEVFVDGRMDWASAEGASGSTMLAEGLMPSISDLQSDPQFEPEEIAADQFDLVWGNATQA